MRKKVFFILSSFSAGGAERVFWLLCQAFNKTKFDVTVILLNNQNNSFNLNLPDVRVISLNTVKSSKSFFPLLELVRREKPFAIYSTGGEINFLVSLISNFINVPFLIARGTNIPEERYKYYSIKSKILSKIAVATFGNFNYIISQSEEMLKSWTAKGIISSTKLVLIPNPVLKTAEEMISKGLTDMKKLIIVARLSSVKGHDRLLDILADLPGSYELTIAGGDGGERKNIERKINVLGLSSRVNMVGEVDNPCKMISQHSILVVSSYTEGFPNVVLEALSVGIPVVTFKVGGVANMIIEDFNGYIVEQGDNENFKKCIVNACNKRWDHDSIAKDVQRRFSIDKIVKQYEELINIS